MHFTKLNGKSEDIVFPIKIDLPVAPEPPDPDIPDGFDLYLDYVAFHVFLIPKLHFSSTKKNLAEIFFYLCKNRV